MLVSKYEQMVKILKKSIERGDFPVGARLTSENELSRQHGISRNTVREAISSLVQQGYMTRTQGKGTFVTGRRPAGPTSDSYAIFLHAHSHVFEAETRALVRAFQQAGSLPIVFDVEDFKETAQAEAILAKVLDQGVTGLVLEDQYRGLVVAVCKRTGRKPPPMAVVNFGAGPDSLPVKCVYSDFRFGTHMGAKHLIGLGHRRILFVIHRQKYAEPGVSVEKATGLYGEVCGGYSDALEEAGLGAQKDYFFVDHEFRLPGDDRERLKAVLMGPDRPDAVFAFGDYRAKHVIDIAMEAGLRVPDDLAVVGYWNTPWAEMTRVALTSVSIREDEIARVAADKLLQARRDGKGEPEMVIVKPRLVVRDSCGASRKSA